MIGKIKGILIEIDGNKGLIDTASGVGYEVFLTPILLGKTIGSEIEVITYLQVREDNLTLYGFENRKQFKLYEMLLSVDGVGPKSAFSIISNTHSDELLQAVSVSNVEYFSSIQGIGKKTAQKILLELSHRIKKGFELDSLALSADDSLLYGALESLGFNRSEVRGIVAKLDPTQPVEERIKHAIQLMTSNKK